MRHDRPQRPAITALLAASAVLTLAACASTAGPGQQPSGSEAASSTAATTSSTPAATSSTPAATKTPGTADVSGTAAAPGEPAPVLADLVNPDGSPFDLASYAGAPTLLFFGYTHCPDVCPATIGEIIGVFEADATARAVFVSIDPERDTPEHLATWTEYLPDRFDAITGSPGAVRRAADEYGVRYARVETTSTAGYTMSHTADLYLIDGEGRLRLTYPFGTPAATIVADLSRLDAG